MNSSIALSIAGLCFSLSSACCCLVALDSSIILSNASDILSSPVLRRRLRVGWESSVSAPDSAGVGVGEGLGLPVGLGDG